MCISQGYCVVRANGRGLFVWFTIQRGMVTPLALTSTTRTVLRKAVASFGLLLTVLIGGFFHSALAQHADVEVGERLFRFRQSGFDWKDCGLRKVEVNAFTSVRPETLKKRSATATINVDYSGFSAEAREAFERAVSIWERHIQSSIPIRIDASFEERDPGVLGGTRPVIRGLDTDEDGVSEIAMVDALVDVILERDVGPGSADFQMVINSARDDWHFGNGDAPAGTVDFTSVVLHEIAHGLGYVSNAQVNSNEGTFGFENSEGELFPLIYTDFLYNKEDNNTLTAITNESEFSNPSLRLGDVLTGNQLVFNGEHSIATTDSESEPVPPKVHAPSSFELGSSISHLDEDTYQLGTENALMTPRLSMAETNRLPGPILCGQLKDMLWPLGDGCKRYLADVFALEFSETPDPSEGSVQLSWQVREDADPQEFIVERKYFDGPFEPVANVQSPPARIDSLGLGKFEFRVRWIRSDGSVATTPQTIQTTFRARDVDTEIVERDEQGRAEVAVSWSVPPGTDDFVYEVQRKRGLTGSFEAVTTVPETDHTLPRQSPGRYAFRITGKDGAGNTVVGQATAQVEVDFEGSVYVLGPYPNPVRETASFDLTARSAQPVSIGVYNVAGQRLYSETRELNAQAPEFLSIDTSQWSSGMYFLRVSGREFTKTRRLVVAR